MPITKSTWRRSTAVLLCVMLLFSTAFSFAAYADNAVVTSGSMYSYFQTYGSNGQWKDIQTPSHWITSTGEVAYCLQTSKDTPYNSSYTTVDGEDYYNDYVLTGLMAILQHGYPVTNAGFTDEQARYATANAIRFFLAENYADGMPQYLNLNVNGDWIRAKSGYEELYQWALYLVDLARWGDASSGTSGSLSFSPTSVTLTEDADGQYFTGYITVNKNTSQDYGLAYNLPDGTLISGYTGTKSETLSLMVPIAYADRSYSICAYGGHDGNVARLFFWAPSATNQQRIVTYVLESTGDYLESYATIITPAAKPKVGGIEITKTDESGNPLSGVSFELYTEVGRLVGSGQTSSRGIISFSNLELGTYYYKETATLSGYILDSDYHEVNVEENGQIVKVTVKNSREGGSVSIIKADAKSGAALSGVHFKLLDSTGKTVAEGDTGTDGKLTFSGIALGSYTVKETATATGYVLDGTARPVTISTNGQTVEVRVTNEPATGKVVVVKTDADTGEALLGVHFKLTDSSGAVVKEGDTGADGKLTFSGIPLGSYTLTETATKEGYVLNSSPISVSLTSNGQTVTKSITNSKGRGSIIVTKTDHETDAPLEGVHFKLVDSAGALVAEGDTEEDGRLYFENIPVGTYSLIETATIPGYVLDETPYEVTIPANGKMVFLSIENDPASGAIEINKVDAETSEPLAGVHFILKDSAGAVVKEGSTDNDGKLSFAGLALGDYTLTETVAKDGYVLGSTPIIVTLSSNGQTVTKEIRNTRAVGSVEVEKADAETGKPLPGVHFKLLDAAGEVIREGDTGEDGKLSFSGLPLGSYSLVETETAEGYVPDETARPISITENGQLVQVKVENTPFRAPLKVVKKDAHENTPLAGAGYQLLDATGTKIAEGYTDANGELTFNNLLPGNYQIREFAAPRGYMLDEATYPVSIVAEAVTETRTDLRRPGTLEVTKQDAKGKPLAGATFLLEFSTDEGKTWNLVQMREGTNLTAGGCSSPGLTDGQLTTGTDGKITFTGLRADGSVRYRLTETKAPPGMNLMGESIEIGSLPVESKKTNAEDTEVFDGKAFHYTLGITATDNYQYRLPETGGSHAFLLVSLTMTLMCVPAITIYEIKKKRRFTE